MEQVMAENAAKPERQTEGAYLYHISQDPSDDLIFLYRPVEVSVLCPSPGVTFKSSASVWMCLIKIYKQSHTQRYTGQVLAKSWISLRCESRFASWARTTRSAGPLSPHLRNNTIYLNIRCPCIYVGYLYIWMYCVNSRYRYISTITCQSCASNARKT